MGFEFQESHHMCPWAIEEPEIQSTSTANLALEKFGHNRFNTFVNDCKILSNSGTLEKKDLLFLPCLPT
jgi:hypothetical protein